MTMMTIARLGFAIFKSLSTLICESLEIRFLLHRVRHMRSDERVPRDLARELVIEVAYVRLIGGSRRTELRRVLLVVHFTEVEVTEETSLFQLLCPCRTRAQTR